MRLLELVPCCRKGVFLVDPDAVERHFPAPITANEISSLYSTHRFSGDSGITVPAHDEHQRRETYSLTPVCPDSEGELQNRRRSSRRNGRNSLSNSPECRRLLSFTKPWKPSLDVISEDRVVCVAKDEQKLARSAKKTAGKPASAAKLRVYAVRDELRHGSAPIAIPSFAPTAFLF